MFEYIALPRLSRVLQSSDNHGAAGEHPIDSNQLAGYVFWYILLLLCCAVPSICAYRRRQHDNRMDRIAHLHQMAANGIVTLGNAEPDDSEERREAKLQRIGAAIKDTTMEVTSKDLLTRTECSTAAASVDEEAIGPEEAAMDDSTREFAALKLNLNHENGGREVPASCAVCLCAYESGDEVTYSPNVACQHVFHTECIKAWMVKKEKPLCPCCRQEFCTLGSTNQAPPPEGTPTRVS